MEWKVYKSTLEVKPHFNADSLELVTAGDYQFVAQKGLYQTGQEAIVIPEKSVLPPNLQPHWANYLKGPDKNRVGSVRLRGEISQGILLNRTDAETILGKSLDEFTSDEDISELLNIKKYEAYIPPSMAGKQGNYDGYHHYHDCVQYGSWANAIQDDEEVIVTEKIHGSQLNYIYHVETGEEFVGTKGMLNKSVVITEYPESPNLYWQAVRNSRLKELALEVLKHSSEPWKVIQIISEAIPCQKGYSYGISQPEARVFGITYYDGKNEVHKPYANEYPGFKGAHVIFQGKYGEIKHKLRELAEGMEQVSGNELHIREGIVIRPNPDRKSHKGNWLRLKIISPKYKESGEELS